MQETWVQFLGQEDALEKETARQAVQMAGEMAPPALWLQTETEGPRQGAAWGRGSRAWDKTCRGSPAPRAQDTRLLQPEPLPTPASP